MKNSRFFQLLMVLAGLAACTERYDIELDSSYARLVVDGKVTSDSLQHTLRLTTSTSYFYNEEPPAVTGAAVRLYDGEESIPYVEDAQRPGYYHAAEAFAGKAGRLYRIEIELAAPVGDFSSYEASSLMPLTFGRIDSITLKYEPSFDFYLLNLFATDPATTDFYKFDAYVNGKILTDTASRALVTDDKFFNGNNTNGLPVMFFRGDEIKPGDTITLQLAAITEDYYRFFLELQTGSGSSNPLFSGPAANIRTNVSNGALGYFAAARLARASLIVPQN